MESNLLPDIVQAANRERQRLESLLRADPLFKKLEAVCRVIELYETEVPGYTDTIESPPADEKEFEPINDEVQARDVLPADPPTSAKVTSRRRWTHGNSTTSRILAASEDYLRRKGRPAKGTEICGEIMKLGIEITGQKPSATVAARLSSSAMFVHDPKEGYGLREWSNGNSDASA